MDLNELLKQFREMKDLLKFYYSKYEFCGTKDSPNWKVMDKTNEILKGEKKCGDYYYPNIYMDDAEESEEPDIEIDFQQYEMKPEVFCEALKKARCFLNPTKEQAEWLTEHEKEIKDIFQFPIDECLVNIEQEDYLIDTGIYGAIFKFVKMLELSKRETHSLVDYKIKLTSSSLNKIELHYKIQYHVFDKPFNELNWSKLDFNDFLSNNVEKLSKIEQVYKYQDLTNSLVIEKLHDEFLKVLGAKNDKTKTRSKKIS